MPANASNFLGHKTTDTDYRRRLRKHRRSSFDTGNRNPHTNARAYYAWLARDTDTFHATIARLAAIPDKLRESRAIARRVKRDVAALDAICSQIATGLLDPQRFAVHPRYRRHAVRALKAILMYAYHSAHCSAAHANLAARADMSLGALRQTWIPRFIEAGIIEQVSYDWSGTRIWGDNQIASNWKCVYFVPHLASLSTNPDISDGSREAAHLSPSSAARRTSNGGVSTANAHRRPPRPRARAPALPISLLRFEFPKVGEWHWDSCIDEDTRP